MIVYSPSVVSDYVQVFQLVRLYNNRVYWQFKKLVRPERVPSLFPTAVPRDLRDRPLCADNVSREVGAGDL